MDDDDAYWLADYVAVVAETESESPVYQTVLTEKETLLQEKRALDAKIRALPPTAKERLAALENEAEERRMNACHNRVAMIILGWIIGNVVIGLAVLLGAFIYSQATDCSVTGMHFFDYKPAEAGSCNSAPFKVGFIFVLVGLSPLALAAGM